MTVVQHRSYCVESCKTHLKNQYENTIEHALWTVESGHLCKLRIGASVQVEMLKDAEGVSSEGRTWKIWENHVTRRPLFTTPSKDIFN